MRLFAAAVLIVVTSLAACERAASPAKGAGAPATPSPAATVSPSPAAAPSAGEESPASLELPGPLTAQTTVESLRQHFGETNVEIGDVPGAEGETSRGVVLFAQDPARRAYLYFADEKTLRGLAQVRIADPESAWKLDNGIAIGTSLAELVKRNGKPITYSGLGWDYGGAVQDLHGGALQAFQTGPVMRSWRLGPADPDSMADDAYPVGEGSFRSDDPAYPRQGDTVAVNELWVTFSEDGSP